MRVPVCFIVGAGPGNGAAFARQFSRAGFKVALLARGQEGLDTQTQEGHRRYPRLRLRRNGPQQIGPCLCAHPRRAGATPDADLQRLAAALGDIDATSPDAFERAWRVNAFGCLLAAQQVIPTMRAQGKGSLIVIGATASLKGAADFVAFASAKATQRSLTQSLARKLGPEGIHVAYVIIDAMVSMPASRAMVPDAPDSFFRPARRCRRVRASSSPASRGPPGPSSFDLRPFAERW